MARFEFEEVWDILRQLEDQTIATLVRPRKNQIIRFKPEGMLRRTEKKGGGWRDTKLVRKSVFKGMWDRLITQGFTEAGNGDWAIAAACFVRVPELGVEIVQGRFPRTIIIRDGESTFQINSKISTDDEDPEEFGDRERIVLDPEICSGKPTVKGTRIMVSNLLGMFSGGYSIKRILKAYPELSRLDVISAVEYASRVVNRENMVAGS